MATDFFRKTFNPAKFCGQVWLRTSGAATPFLQIGNVLELSLEHKESVETQVDMTRMGGGIHAEVRRVTDVVAKMKLADLNAANIARAILGAGTNVPAGTVVGEAHAGVQRGSLMATAHLQPTDVIVKKGVVTISASSYEVLPEGVYILPGATDVVDDDDLTIDYAYADYAAIEALISKPPPVEILFGGLNEAESGKPANVRVHRCSFGIAKELELLSQKGFGAVEVTGSVLKDPTRSGVGLSPYYTVTMN